MMKKILFYVAAAGWVTSLVVNLYTFQDPDLFAKHGYVWLLQAGIFIVWLPAVLELRKNEELKQFKSRSLTAGIKPFGLYRILLKDVPLFIAALAIGSMVYALSSFIYIEFLHGGITNISHEAAKGVSRNIDGNSTRLFSSVWMVFYGMGAAILYPYKDVPLENKPDVYDINNYNG